ncbi:MAG TPA: LysR substrate-binding domain-containing protein [Burkholderiales bacterium]|jgi:DNA-binding transcriptional LysR family regulator|nr:LysR substrate-binding domain-containing protein [Burkholderiales bacterium]
MELRHLRYFVAVAEELHFGRAAARLHVSQPPLSQQIRSLEDELGVRLFRRSTQHVELTEGGRALLPEARAVLARTERAIHAARSAARGEVQRLALSFVGSLDHELVSSVLNAFRKRHPRVAITLAQMTSVEQLAALREGEVDAGFVRLPLRHRALECELVVREPFFAVLPQTHRLAHKRRIEVAALADEPFVMFERHTHPGLHSAIVALCRASGFVPQVVQESERLQNIVVMVAGGIGVSLVPRSVSALKTPGAVFRPLTGAAAAATLETGVVYRKGSRSATLEAFLESVRTYAAKRLRDA